MTEGPRLSRPAELVRRAPALLRVRQRRQAVHGQLRDVADAAAGGGGGARRREVAARPEVVEALPVILAGAPRHGVRGGTARAGNRSFRLLSALRAHTKTPYKADFH